MSHNITVEGGKSVRLPTAGKYCDRDIVVTAEGGTADVANVIVALITGSNYVDDIESDVTSIRSYAFYGTDFKNIRLPNLTTVSSRCFYECRSLESVYIPNVEALSGYDFRYCVSLKSIELPKVKTISAYSFHACTTLQTVILRTDTVCTLENVNAFSNMPVEKGAGYIYVPSALVDGYKSATNWSTYESQIRAIEDYPDICG